MELYMVQLKLTLKSNRPSVVYSTNGKSYRLQPGSNTLNLEYEDYLALAKALSIKPILNNDNKEKHDKVSNETPHVDKNHVAYQHTEDSNTDESANTENNGTSKDTVSETPVNEQLDQHNNESHEDESVKEESHEDESVKEESHEDEESLKDESHDGESVKDESNDDESVKEDYSSMSYTELKAKYKEVTGKSCKLKKDEIIAFLQEHSDNAE
jgi:hypothetical protein